jgi:hypothetical protein
VLQVTKFNKEVHLSMNGVEYYRDRRVDRSQYKGLSFRLRDGVLELAVKTPLPACAAGGPSPGGVGCRRAHAGLYNPEVECRPDGYSAAYAPCDRRHAPAMCNDSMAHAQSGIRTKQTLAVECRPGLQTQP